MLLGYRERLLEASRSTSRTSMHALVAVFQPPIQVGLRDFNVEFFKLIFLSVIALPFARTYSPNPI